jgi:hypothetical protein
MDSPRSWASAFEIQMRGKASSRTEFIHSEITEGAASGGIPILPFSCLFLLLRRFLCTMEAFPS